MRIAIATDWFPPRQGGIEAQLAALATRLAARGHDVTVITSTPGASSGGGVDVRRIDGARLPGADLAISPRLPGVLRALLNEPFDVVHAHVSVMSPVGYLAAFAASARRTPTLVTFHSVLRIKRAVLALANAVLRLNRSAIVWSAVSERVAGEVRGALGPIDVGVLPNGIDLGFWRKADTDAGQSARPVTFVSAIRLQRKKRPHQLLRAFGRAVAESGPARLVVAGSGPELRALRASADAMNGHGAASVQLPGWRDAPGLKDLYRQADAFVLPTRHEAFGIAALEARAAGLPVFASRQAGCREFLRHDENALLFGSDEDLAALMARFIREPALRQRLRAGDAMLERYDWNVVLAEHERLYEIAMRRRSPVPLAHASAAPASR